MDFTESEVEVATKHVNNRWRDGSVQVHLADIEIVPPGEKEAKLTPALVWENKQSTFVVLKIGSFNYKSFFYFGKDKRFDTGIDQYNDLNECVDHLMKAQADFVLSKNTKGLKVEINKDIK
jgi:hypothetical protein